MQILKLFFEHDLRLDDLAERNAGRGPAGAEATLSDFMKPDPTYSKFYLSATDLEKEQFGISILDRFDELVGELDSRMQPARYRTRSHSTEKLSQILEMVDIGEAILITSEENPVVDLESIGVGAGSNVGHFKEKLREILMDGYLVLYKEQAHDGFDLHLFSRENIYPRLFHACKTVLSDNLRLFSINGKKMRTEKHFYFETWSLDRPPHGAEEVLQDTEI